MMTAPRVSVAGMTRVGCAGDATPGGRGHNGRMPIRLRRLVAGLPVPWTDVVLAVVLAVAGVIWVLKTRQSGDSPIPPAVMLFRAPRPPGLGVREIVVSDNATDVGRAIIVNVVAGLALVVRRRLPYTALIIALGGILVLRDDLVWPGFIAIVIAAYSAVAYGRSVWWALMLLFAGAVIAASEFSNSIPPMPGWFSPFAILAPAGLAAATIRSARARADASARRALALEHEKEATTRAAIAEERARIARELHDVVSHHVSVMVIQAGAAGKVIDTRPDLASEALRAIEASGREAMGELRHLLGLVAPLDDRLHPQPGLADLGALVGAVRAAGQPVTLRHDAGAVPQGVDLTAYRVVQEGLTNALRYAPGASTSVELRRDGDALVVEVRNDRPVTPVPPAAVGRGSGLVGLTERLRLHRGTLDSGRRIDGGFRITACIPIPATMGPS
jgi:signal transduction histidine kinase